MKIKTKLKTKSLFKKVSLPHGISIVTALKIVREVKMQMYNAITAQSYAYSFSVKIVSYSFVLTIPKATPNKTIPTISYVIY